MLKSWVGEKGAGGGRKRETRPAGERVSTEPRAVGQRGEKAARETGYW